MIAKIDRRYISKGFRYTEEQKANASCLYEQGLSCRQVSSATGISTAHVRTILHSRGVVLRPSGFQSGNKSQAGLPRPDYVKQKISEIHKRNKHKPTREAAEKGQPRSLAIRWGSHTKNLPGQLCKKYRSGAVKRGLVFDLTEEQFASIIGSPCFYCGGEPTGRLVARETLVCNGVDRINNLLGYTSDNCVPACKVCNMMKGTNSWNEYVAHCRKVAKQHETI